MRWKLDARWNLPAILVTFGPHSLVMTHRQIPIQQGCYESTVHRVIGEFHMTIPWQIETDGCHWIERVGGKSRPWQGESGSGKICWCKSLILMSFSVESHWGSSSLGKNLAYPRIPFGCC